MRSADLNRALGDAPNKDGGFSALTLAWEPACLRLIVSPLIVGIRSTIRLQARGPQRGRGVCMT
jgi:hypothetical protein